MFAAVACSFFFSFYLHEDTKVVHMKSGNYILCIAHSYAYDVTLLCS
jgi:hypothetical protein